LGRPQLQEAPQLLARNANFKTLPYASSTIQAGDQDTDGTLSESWAGLRWPDLCRTVIAMGCSKNVEINRKCRKLKCGHKL
jgi:hypothetical protein